MSTQKSVSEWIARWGNPASIALLDPACQIFTTPKVPGIMGYRVEAHHAIVFGDPLCEPGDQTALASSFHDQFEDQVKNIIYVAATEQFKESSLAEQCEAAIEIGHEIILDPTCDPRAQTGEKASQLRRNCKQALRNEVTVQEYLGHDAALEAAMNELGEIWTQGRHGPQVYLQQVTIFSDREHKRYFYAQAGGKLIGLLIFNRLDAYEGWVLTFSLVHPEAPNGTSELMMVSAMEILGKEQCRFLAIGTVPAPCIEEICGLGQMSTWFVKNTYPLAIKLFHLSERGRYWKKFGPTCQSTYLVLGKSHFGLRGALGIFSALNSK